MQRLSIHWIAYANRNHGARPVVGIVVGNTSGGNSEMGPASTATRADEETHTTARESS